MNLINLESHFLSSAVLSISQDNINQYISALLKLHIYPQEFNEVLPNGEMKKQFMFINPMEGKRVLFQNNRISFVVGFPNKKVSDEELMKENKSFLSFIDSFFNEIKSLSPNMSFNRLSYVVRYANIEGYSKEMSGIERNTLSTFKWSSTDKETTDFNLTYGYRSEIEEEEINNIFKLLMATFNTHTPGNPSKQPCLVKEVDVNTIDENRNDRFEYDSSLKFVTKLMEESHERVKLLNGI